MAHAPNYKVYSKEGEYLASVKYLEDAAALVSFLGDGATVRDGHTKARTLWEEGKDGAAGASFDRAANRMRSVLGVYQTEDSIKRDIRRVMRTS